MCETNFRESTRTLLEITFFLFRAAVRGHLFGLLMVLTCRSIVNRWADGCSFAMSSPWFAGGDVGANQSESFHLDFAVSFHHFRLISSIPSNVPASSPATVSIGFTGGSR